MNKTYLEQYKNKELDLLFWIKNHLAIKVYKLKINKDVKDFNREYSSALILNSSNIDELKDNANLIAQSISGLRNYSSPLVAFYNHVINDKKILDLKKIDTNYINTYTKLNKLSSNYYVQVKSLFQFIDKNILDDFRFDIGYKKDGTKAKLPVKLSKEKTYNFLEPEIFAKFIGKIKDYKSNHPNPYLIKLMLKFLCFGGLRADEVQHIKEEDISFRNMNKKDYMQIYILGKGNKERFVYILFDLVKNEYENYLKIKKEKNHNIEYLFYTRDIKMFSDKRIYDIVKLFHESTNLNVPNFTTHTLRRSYASFLHYSGVKLETISLLLGHSQEETVEFYVFASKEKTKKVPDLFKYI